MMNDREIRTVVRQMIAVDGSGARRAKRQIRVALAAVGVSAKVRGHQMLQAGTDGWIGGPTEISARIEAATLEQEGTLCAIAREFGGSMRVARASGSQSVTVSIQT